MTKVTKKAAAKFAAKTASRKLATENRRSLEDRARALGLWGLIANWQDMHGETWLPRLIEMEESERHKRSLERRIRCSKLGIFKPIADFDWSWPKSIDSAMVEEIMHLDFLAEGINILLVGPNGVGKTTIAKNIAHKAILSGTTVRFTSASELMCDLAAQDSTQQLIRRVKKYTSPGLLVIDEIGYLSATSKHADLLFEVVTRRYQEEKSIVLTTNKGFSEWPEVFPSAACVVAMIDRLVHRSETILIEANSYRNKEAQERAAIRAMLRRKKKDGGSVT